MNDACNVVVVGWAGGLMLAGSACGGEDRTLLSEVAPEVVEAPLDPEALDPAGVSPARGDAVFYDFGHRVEIAVELAPDDWELVRNEGRSLAALFDPALPFEYTRVIGSVSIDGERYEQVQVRKKGFLGSLSALKPSLKLDLGEVIEGQTHLGVRRLTLNNDKQDGSHTHTCMAYRAFARAGLPASRCNIAHVSVNGEDLGTYSNVEPVGKDLLRRHFASAEGNLYEAQATDVVDALGPRMEAKTNEASNDRSDLVALAAALEAGDAELIERLGAELDLDRFRTFWALETLLGHWDGYSGNTNNYFLYRDPVSQRFSFLPWGTDSAFQGVNPFDALNRDVSVYAAGRIANRLYRLPAERAAFRVRLTELASSVWREPLLLADVDQIEVLAPDASALELALQRQHISTHRGALEAALAAPARDWDDSGGLFASPCIGQSSEVSGSFSTRFGDLDAPAPGGELQLEVDGAPVAAAWFVSAGFDAATGGPDPRVRYVSPLAEGRALVVELVVPRSRFGVGARVFHGLETYGLVATSGPAGASLVGFIGDGGLRLGEASTMDAAPVAGELRGRLVQFGCADL